MKRIIILIFSVIVLLTKATEVSADISVAETSGQLKKNMDSKGDVRAIKLSKFFESYNSPLSVYADKFIFYADKYNLDWRLVAAISGVESTFAKQIPYGSYNAYGWAAGAYRFKSWEDSIEVVSRSLKEDYIEKGAPSLTRIGRRYCPPNPLWIWRVKFFMDKIEPLPVSFTLEG